MPGIARSTLGRIAPRMTAALERVIARVGGRFTGNAAAATAATESAAAARGGRAVSGAGRIFGILIIGLDVVFGSGAGRLQAEQIEHPERILLTPEELRFSQEDVEALMRDIEAARAAEDAGSKVTRWAPQPVF